MAPLIKHLGQLPTTNYTSDHPQLKLSWPITGLLIPQGSPCHSASHTLDVHLDTCLRQLPAANDTYKFSFYPRISDWNRLPINTHHQPPEPSGIQGCPCKPPSHTPHVKLDPQLPVNSFKLELGCFYLLLSGITVLYRV